MYTFFSSSTHRWKVLFDNLNKGQHQSTVLLKRCSVTRWSARADAVSVLNAGFKDIQNALSDICNDEVDRSVVVDGANSLLKQMVKPDIG